MGIILVREQCNRAAHHLSMASIPYTALNMRPRRAKRRPAWWVGWNPCLPTTHSETAEPSRRWAWSRSLCANAAIGQMHHILVEQDQRREGFGHGPDPSDDGGVSARDGGESRILQ